MADLDWIDHARGVLGQADQEWIAGLPDIGVFVQRGRRYAVIHGGVEDSSGRLWPTTSDEDFAGEIAAIIARVGHVDGVVAGHSGIAFHRVIGAHHWINPGSLGLPPHDGRSQTRFAVLDDGDAIIHRLSYDVEAAQAAMRSAGLASNYAKSLGTGIWPDERILPVELRR